jgi:hypothetical protein
MKFLLYKEINETTNCHSKGFKSARGFAPSPIAKPSAKRKELLFCFRTDNNDDINSLENMRN